MFSTLAQCGHLNTDYVILPNRWRLLVRQRRFSLLLRLRYPFLLINSLLLGTHVFMDEARTTRTCSGFFFPQNERKWTTW